MEEVGGWGDTDGTFYVARQESWLRYSHVTELHMIDLGIKSDIHKIIDLDPESYILIST